MNIQSFLDNIIFLSLLLLTIISWANVMYSNVQIIKNISFYGLLTTNLLIFSLLGLRWIQFGYFPLSNLYESLMFLAWGITFISLVTKEQSQVSIISALGSPIALFVSGFASLSLPEQMQAPSPLVPALKSNWLMMHVTVMMLSYASLMIGSLLGILFLALCWGQNEEVELQGSSIGTFTRQQVQMTATLEEKIPKENNRLSLLETIDNLSYRTISFGFPFLTIGIIAGAVWANEAWGSYWSWDPKETWALITWLVFASYLHARITKTWQGKKPAIIAAIGFVVVWICYLGVNFLGKGLHTYGQIL
jgi:cytochrome c-type biogenesis protein CcsB